jgi:hypothetical protein
MGLQSPTPTVADWTKMMWGPFNPSLWSGQRGSGAEAPGSGTPSSPPPPPPPGQDNQELRGLVDELRRQIAQLQEQLSRSKKSQPKRTPQ